MILTPVLTEVQIFGEWRRMDWQIFANAWRWRR